MKELIPNFINDTSSFYHYLTLNLAKSSKEQRLADAYLLAIFYNEDKLLTKDIDYFIKEIFFNYFGLNSNIKLNVLTNGAATYDAVLTEGLEQYQKRPDNGQKVEQADLFLDLILYNLLKSAYIVDAFARFTWYEEFVETIAQTVFARLNINDMSSSQIITSKIKQKTYEKNKDSMLAKYGIWLTQNSYAGDPAIGRQKELTELELAMLLPEKSILLVGEAGVGKTALVHSLAYHIAKGEVPHKLQDREIVKLNLNALISGTTLRGQFEERLETIIKELQDCPHIWLYVEEMHSAVGFGNNSNNWGLANILKPYLASGDIRLIGDTTIEEYHKYILPDRAFRRRFKTIEIKEPTRGNLFMIMQNTILKLEAYYGISFSFSLPDREYIFNVLGELTQNGLKYQKDGTLDTKQNPDLVLDVLKNIFAYAALYDHDAITLTDITKGIALSDEIYSSRREEAIKKIKNYDQTSAKLIRLPHVEFPN